MVSFFHSSNQNLQKVFRCYLFAEIDSITIGVTKSSSSLVKEIKKSDINGELNYETMAVSYFNRFCIKDLFSNI